VQASKNSRDFSTTGYEGGATSYREVITAQNATLANEVTAANILGRLSLNSTAYRLSKASYRKLFEAVWGADSFAIQWPPDVEKVCATPGPPPRDDQYPVHLGVADRQRADHVYDGFGLAAAAYEASPEVSPFTSKYDYVQSGKEQFTPQEASGYALFRGKAGCNQCHRDGGPGKEPLFTDFTASNLGVPRNSEPQYYYEDMSDRRGYRANPSGQAFVDTGVGSFLRTLQSDSGQLNPDSHWVGLAAKFDPKFQVPTLRNVDMRSTPDFVKAYMHNGYFKSLKEVVHFYNTRDVLPRCKAGDPGEKVTCWPPPEDSTNLNKKQLGNLKLTNQEEDDLVAFLKTLTDNYKGSSPATKKQSPAQRNHQTRTTQSQMESFHSVPDSGEGIRWSVARSEEAWRSAGAVPYPNDLRRAQLDGRDHIDRRGDCKLDPSCDVCK
jgi:cytochrome c peroxidase